MALNKPALYSILGIGVCIFLFSALSLMKAGYGKLGKRAAKKQDISSSRERKPVKEEKIILVPEPVTPLPEPVRRAMIPSEEPQRLAVPPEKAGIRNVGFILYSSKAKSMYITGSFNNWNTRQYPLKKAGDNKWTVNLQLVPGKYFYQFIIDGKRQKDPNKKDSWDGGPGIGECSSLVVNPL